VAEQPVGFHSAADVSAIAAASFLLSIFGLPDVVTSRCAANANEMTRSSCAEVVVDFVARRCGFDEFDVGEFVDQVRVSDSAT